MDDKFVIEKLDGSNWTTWKFQIRHLLLAKGLWEHVEGTSTAPEGDGDEAVKKRAEFLQNAQKALSAIVLSIRTTHLYLITS